MDIEGGANRSIVSLKLGGAAPQKLWGIYFGWIVLKSQDCSVFKLNLSSLNGIN